MCSPSAAISIPAVGIQVALARGVCREEVAGPGDTTSLEDAAPVISLQDTPHVSATQPQNYKLWDLNQAVFVTCPGAPYSLCFPSTG